MVINRTKHEQKNLQSLIDKSRLDQVFERLKSNDKIISFNGKLKGNVPVYNVKTTASIKSEDMIDTGYPGLLTDTQKVDLEFKIMFLRPGQAALPRNKNYAHASKIYFTEKDFISPSRIDEVILMKIKNNVSGFLVEEKVANAVRRLVKDDGRNDGIIDVYRPSWRRDVKFGEDLIVVFRRSGFRENMPLQVKSSYKGQKEHIKKYGSRCPSINVKKDTAHEEIQLKISRIMEAWSTDKILHL